MTYYQYGFIFQRKYKYILLVILVLNAIVVKVPNIYTTWSTWVLLDTSNISV